MADLSGLSTNFFPTPKEGFTTTTSGTVDSSTDTTIGFNSVSGLNNGDIFTGLIDPGNAKERAFTGVVDTGGSQITNVVFTTGSNATHTAGATVVDYVTSTHIAQMTKGIKVSHDNDGTLKAGAVDNAAVLASDVVTTAKILDANVTTAKIADSNVTTAKIADGDVTSEKLGATISVRAYRNAAKSISTEEDIVFDAESWDVGADFSTSTGKLTAPNTGKYRVYCQIRLTNLGDGATANLRLYGNGTITALSTIVGASAGGDPTVSCGDTISVTAGQEIKATLECSGSTALAVGSTGSFITIEYVGE